MKHISLYEFLLIKIRYMIKNKIVNHVNREALCFIFFRKDVNFMGWITKYDGPAMDKTLEKGRALKDVSNGWIKLASTEKSPTDLNSLKNPGNYTTSFWVNGPDFGEDVDIITPLNVSVISINTDIYQMVDLFGLTYTRILKNGKSDFTQWTSAPITGSLSPSPTIPEPSIDGKTVWLDTSNPNAPTLKLYMDGEWAPVISTQIMQSTVYDSQGKKTDIFKYIEDAINFACFGNSSETSFSTHTENTALHMSTEENIRWNDIASEDDVNNMLSLVQSELEMAVETAISDDANTIAALNDAANMVEHSGLEDHIDIIEIHPSSDKIAAWNNKADGDHKHELDNNVMVTPSNIDGIIPEDKLPFDAKERVYTVSSESELYQIVKNPVHNGDVFYIENNSGNTWYFVVDDIYLGSDDAFKAFRKFSAITEIDWNDITNTPTSLAGYGIIDGVTQYELEAVHQSASSIKEGLPELVGITAVADTQTEYNSSIQQLNVLNKMIYSLDLAISKFESINS